MSDDYADRFEAFETAVADRDLPRAAQLAVEMEESEPAISDLLDQFDDAVADDEREKAESIARKIRYRYEERRAERRRAAAKARAARNDPSLSEDERRTLEEYLARVSSGSLTRSSFFTRAATYFATPDEAETEDVRSTTSDLNDAEAKTEQSEQDAITTADDASVPPSVAVVDVGAARGEVDPTGGDVTVTVANVGDDPATGIELSAAVDDGTVSPATRSLDDLPGGEEASATFAVAPDEGESLSLTAEVSSTNAGGETEKRSLPVATGKSLADYTDADGNVSTASLQRAIVDWAENEISTELLQIVLQTWADS